MKQRSRTDAQQPDLFQAQFDQILNPDHPMVILANKIDWKRFDAALEPCFHPEVGAPALPTRLMVGLLYLKHAFSESDKSLVERWVDNPYWQYFCGFSTFQHEFPLYPMSLVKWRQRMGAERLAELLQETIALALREKKVTPYELRQVNVDTTVQEKNITYPTDSKLFHKAIEKSVGDWRVGKISGLRFLRSRPTEQQPRGKQRHGNDDGPVWNLKCPEIMGRHTDWKNDLMRREFSRF